uniref:Putative 41 kDa family salivary secreted protein n=1 Tax=Anopheles triannulatus TaxID=58253 RepID=A0A2M3ZY70_9DIPT
MNRSTSIVLGLLIAVIGTAPLHVDAFWFSWFHQQPTTTVNQPSAATGATTTPTEQSNVTLALGNRVNTDTGLTDYGTNVDGLGINVNRRRRRRRRRDIWNIESNPVLAGLAANNPVNGSYIAIGNQVFTLPNNLSNVSLNIAAGSSSSSSGTGQTVPPSISNFLPTIPANYTQAFETLVTQFQTQPLDAMDTVVQTLSNAYTNTIHGLFTEAGLKGLNETLEHGRSVIETGIESIVDQGAQGFEQVIGRFNNSSARVQQCVGPDLTPTGIGRRVVGKGMDCVNRKWRQLSDIGGRIAGDILAADRGALDFLKNLTTCNGANFNAAAASNGGGAGTRNALRRQCYVRAIGNFPQSLLFLPVSLTIESGKLYAALSSLQSDVALCGGEMGLEIGLVTAQVSSKIAFCQVFQP